MSVYKRSNGTIEVLDDDGGLVLEALMEPNGDLVIGKGRDTQRIAAEDVKDLCSALRGMRPPKVRVKSPSQIAAEQTRSYVMYLREQERMTFKRIGEEIGGVTSVRARQIYMTAKLPRDRAEREARWGIPCPR
jgi:hypothetical protein